jgi:NAD(P)-dependent dehydrogenase (short-subunit alcohol dehydrogenase family)
VLLNDKVAVIYGGGGKVGSGVAGAFAREGARVFLAGRTLAPLERAAAELGAAGVAELDVMDAEAVDAHADAVVAAAGRIDISFNLISHGYVQGRPLVAMEPEDYAGPVESAVRSTFLTARAAARHMIPQRSGVILAFGGAANPSRGAHLGSLQVALHAVEAMRRQLASELGPYGIRTVTLLTSGIAETIPAGVARRDEMVAGIERSTLLGRAATLEDVGNVAAFAASDHARTITGASINISCGTFFD